MDAGVGLGHRDLDPAVQPGAELVERAHVVPVPVGDGDSPDRGAGLRRRAEEGVAAVRNRRVDEREAVVLAHEECVDEAQSRELDEVRSELTNAHGGPNLRPVPGERRFETNDACACRLLPGPSDLAPDASPSRDA
jgi:hypothetical protein